jgi:D-alanine-D-alanine ligase
MKHRGIIGVISGGDSPERDVSLVSGRQVHAALLALDYTATLVEITTLDDLVPKLRGVDLAFNCLHGGSGEDGTVQLLLEVLDIPYPGSGPQASALCMDKLQTKAVLMSSGLMVPKERTYLGEPIEVFAKQAREALGFPLVLKPRNLGSSIGVRIVDKEVDLMTAVSQIASQVGQFFAEEYISGRELTVGILAIDGEEQALPLVEMRPKERFFDYGAKYTKGRTDFLVPAPLDPTTTHRIQDVSLAAHRALGCAGFSRVDLRLREDGVPFVLEANTLPGMTPTSDLPRAAAAAGISFSQLVEIMLKTTSKEGTA